MNSSVSDTLRKIKSVMAEYTQRLTVRQIYYRLVADHGLENSMRSYKRIVDILSKARLSGEIAYDAIEDRTREILEFDDIGYETVQAFGEKWHKALGELPSYYRLPLWHNQPDRVVVMVEKQALQGIFSRVCERLEVDLMVCKGYPSLTQQWELAERLKERIDEDADLHIIYFGDFDPSGENIPEKLEERLRYDFDVRIESFRKEALTIDQVEELQLPPAPAKLTDTRTAGFVEKYGIGMQVELDAIKPDELSRMIESAIVQHYNKDAGNDRNKELREKRDIIRAAIGKMDISHLLKMTEEDE